MAAWKWALIGAIGCACAGSPAGGIPEGSRLITARVSLVGDAGSGQRRAMQAVAVFARPVSDCGEAVRVGQAGPDRTVSVCAIFGEPFDPGDAGEPMRLVVPCDVTVNVLVQHLASSDGQTPGDVVAVLAFANGAGETTTLIPREMGSAIAPACRDSELLATNVIDMGEISIPADGTGEQVIVGGTEGGTNPLATVDTDGDEVSNLADGDDDDDSIVDELDDDDDGDGAADAAQSFDLSWWSAA